MAITFQPATQAERRYHIRWMVRRDMPEVLDIEAGARAPWDEGHIKKYLAARNRIGMVAEAGDRVVGYMVYALHKRRLHLERLAVHPEYRRRGVCRQLVAKLHGKLSAVRRVSVSALVDERDLDVLLAFRACGFIAFELCKGHFDDGEADGVHMGLPLDALIV